MQKLSANATGGSSPNAASWKQAKAFGIFSENYIIRNIHNIQNIQKPPVAVLSTGGFLSQLHSFTIHNFKNSKNLKINNF
jgi:hypothetical protein